MLQVKTIICTKIIDKENNTDGKIIPTKDTFLLTKTARNVLQHNLPKKQNSCIFHMVG